MASQCPHKYGTSNKSGLSPGLEKVPISQGLVTLLHISTVIPTPQSPISPETPCHTVPLVYIAVPSTIITALIADVAASSEDIAASSADIVTSSTDIVTFKG